MFPGRDILERKFEGYSNQEIYAMATEVRDAAEAVLARRGTSLTDLHQAHLDTLRAAEPDTTEPPQSVEGNTPISTIVSDEELAKIPLTTAPTAHEGEGTECTPEEAATPADLPMTSDAETVAESDTPTRNRKPRNQ
ncbi:MAG: hypothetical protein U0Y68_18425 [Blastocatellia bacterium]